MTFTWNHIEITKFDLYLEYSVHSHISTNISPKPAWKIREESLKSLKQALKQREGVPVTHKYYINLSIEEAHHRCHPTKEIMELSQRVHPELVAKVQELVHAGTTDPVEVHVHHYMHVHWQPSQPQSQGLLPHT